MRRAASLLLAAVVAGCAGSGRGAAPSPAPTAASGAPAANTPRKRVPITFVAPRTGNKYIYLTEQQGNRKVFVLRADAERGEYFGENTGQSTFVNPHTTFFTSNGKRLVADAPRGLVIERAKTVQMSGGVRAKTQDGVRLVSDAMLYNVNTETIHATGNVVMDSAQGNELRGDTLDWNLKTGAVDVSGAR